MTEKIKNKQNVIVRSMFFSLLITLMISALGVSIAGFVDGLSISYFYGETAMASYSLCGPVFKLFGVFTGIVTSGLQIVLSKVLGKGDTKKANQLFTFFFVLCFIVGIILLILGETLAPQLAFIFGATDFSSDLNRQASEYIRGLFIGLPFLFLYSAMLPLYSFDGAKKLIKICALINALIDILFDLLNGYCFGLGIFGMGLATTIGYVVASIPMIVYLFTKKYGLKLDFKSFSPKGCGKVFLYGLPQATRRLSTVTKGIVANFVITGVGGTIALTASGIEGNLFGLLSVLTGCIPSVLISLGGIFLLDHDDKSMKHLLNAISWYVSALVGGITLLVIIFAPFIIKLYSVTDPQTFDTSVQALRISIIALPLATVNTTYMAYLQVTKKLKWTHVFTVIDYCLSYCICYAIFAPTLGTLGLWITLPAVEILNFIIAYIYSCIVNKKFEAPFAALYPLRNDFEDIEAKTLQFNIRSEKEVTRYIETASQFLKTNLKDPKSSTDQTKEILEQLFLIQSPYIKDDGKLKIDLDILIRIKDEKVTVRLRDNNKNNNPAARSELIQKRRELAKNDPQIVVIFDKLNDTEFIDILNIHNCVFKLN